MSPAPRPLFSADGRDRLPRMNQQSIPGSASDPVLQRMRKIIRGGGSLLLDQLGGDELVAMQTMLFDGEAEIINSACRPYLIAKLDHKII